MSLRAGSPWSILLRLCALLGDAQELVASPVLDTAGAVGEEFLKVRYGFGREGGRLAAQGLILIQSLAKKVQGTVAKKKSLAPC